MNYSEIKMSMEELRTYDIPHSSTPFILNINYNDTKFEFIIKNVEKANNVIIMGSGSYDTDKMDPPIFQRHAWIQDFKESVILYNDPTLYLGKITIGWGNGTKDSHFLKMISEILMIITGKMQYENHELYFYGSSAGGYMSMILAGYIKQSTAIVNNPQTIVANFWPNPVREMIQASYPNMTLEEVVAKYPERMDVIEFFKEQNYIPRINYLQNVAATRDVEKHLIPFISGLNLLTQSILSKSVNIELYSDKKNGHNPISKNETIKYIEKIINNH